MIVCQNCGAENEVGRTVCLECGHVLQTQEPQQGGTGEVVPDWLELLFAKYGEQASNIIVSPAAPASVTTQEKSAKEDSSASPGWSLDEVVKEVPAVLEEEEEIPDWLTNLSAGDTTAAPSPSSGEPVAVSGMEEMPPIVSEQQKAVTDWLATLRQIDAETREKPAPEETVEEVPAIVQEDKGEIPTWLRELGEVTQTEEFISSPQPRSELAQPEVVDQDEGEIPAWLDRFDYRTGGGKGGVRAGRGSICGKAGACIIRTNRVTRST